MRTIPDQTFAAVLGSPIEHSLSPILHMAAYRILELNWSYEKYEVTEDQLSGFLDTLPVHCIGLSLTMPLKDVAFNIATTHDDAAKLTGACNTLLPTAQGWAGYNTDVPGFISAMKRADVEIPTEALVLGAGATARSAVAALQLMGVGRVHVAARRLQAIEEIRHMFADVVVHGHSLSDGLPSSSLVINTLPGSVADDVVLPTSVETLFDVIYAPWPTALARKHSSAHVLGGLDLLVAQAVEQVQLMTQCGDEMREPVFQAMYAAGLAEQVNRSSR